MQATVCAKRQVFLLVTNGLNRCSVTSHAASRVVQYIIWLHNIKPQSRTQFNVIVQALVKVFSTVILFDRRSHTSVTTVSSLGLTDLGTTLPIWAAVVTLAVYISYNPAHVEGGQDGYFSYPSSCQTLWCTRISVRTDHGDLCDARPGVSQNNGMYLKSYSLSTFNQWNGLDHSGM
jgi:hypothetical protein